MEAGPDFADQAPRHPQRPLGGGTGGRTAQVLPGQLEEAAGVGLPLPQDFGVAVGKKKMNQQVPSLLFWSPSKMIAKS